MGVAMSATESPDLILMDIALGAMDGWDATRLIKSDPRTTEIPIIALTAHALASDREKSFKVGCSDFDTKPVDLARLLGKIRRAFWKKRSSESGLPDGRQSRRLIGKKAVLEYGKKRGTVSC